ncbi:hypothetical protein BV898_15806 [Hypsibius exemplaris]|uniref:Uncharacterized protein n=1 Tax=Hypsibius exemplaris TaxID=2072580 RepID=A0A9X6RKP6_HYPEX|nr:hypothetical protein BV898_15806 [Hypsibius exemplaris]
MSPFSTLAQHCSPAFQRRNPLRALFGVLRSTSVTPRRVLESRPFLSPVAVLTDVVGLQDRTSAVDVAIGLNRRTNYRDRAN